MRGNRLIATAGAVAVLVGAPAAPVASEELLAVEPPAIPGAGTTPAVPSPDDASNRRPYASFSASPNPAVVGDVINLDGRLSEDSDGTIARHEWDLDGDGTFETDGGTSSAATLGARVPQTLTVRLRVTDDRGDTDELEKDIVVRELPATPRGDGGLASTAGGDSNGSTVPGEAAKQPEPVGTRGRRPRAQHARSPRPRTPVPEARAAGTGVRLDEFSITPSSLRVSRGTTLDVRNVGSIEHNLTIERGPDARRRTEKLAGTSTFRAGGSESLAVDLAPGTYALVCTVPGHREAGMIGRITVVGSAGGGFPGGGGGSGDGAGSGGGGSAGSPGSSGDDSGSGLPRTGLELAWLAALGAALIGAGLSLAHAAGLSLRRRGEPE